MFLPPPNLLPQQPIITQSATVTKITFGGSHLSSPVFSSAEAAAKLIPESSSVRPSGEKPSVSDILKISMMEAEIDPSVEPMVVDSSSDCGPLGKNQAVTMDSGPFISSSGAHHSLSKGPKFSCMPGLTVQRSKEDMEVIEVRRLSQNQACNNNNNKALFIYMSITYQPTGLR